MKKKHYSVSCFNYDTNEVIYHDQKVAAEDQIGARHKADKAQHKAIKKFIKVYSGKAVRRYDIKCIQRLSIEKLITHNSYEK